MNGIMDQEKADYARDQKMDLGKTVFLVWTTSGKALESWTWEEVASEGCLNVCGARLDWGKGQYFGFGAKKDGRRLLLVARRNRQCQSQLGQVARGRARTARWTRRESSAPRPWTVRLDERKWPGQRKGTCGGPGWKYLGRARGEAGDTRRLVLGVSVL